MAAFDGADFMEIAKRFVSAIPHVRELNIGVIAAEPGKAILKLPYQDKLVGNPDNGVLHGGAITTLVDTVCGFAALSAVGDGLPLATLDLRIDYLKPATPDEDLLAEAHAYKMTRNIVFIRSTAYHSDPDDPVAYCVCTFMKGTKGPDFVSGKNRGQSDEHAG
jgi:uncharacterized protein (TIGR00369 family)